MRIIKSTINKLVKIIFRSIQYFIVISLSKFLVSINSMRTWSYIVVGKTTHTVLPFKNISLKMILEEYNILLNSGDRYHMI